MEGILNVSSDKLISTANEFNGTMNQVRTITGNMCDVVNGLSGKWEGDASSKYIQKFNMLQDDIQKLANMINEHVTDLNAMAANYEAVEQDIVNEEESLAGDIIV